MFENEPCLWSKLLWYTRGLYKLIRAKNLSITMNNSHAYFLGIRGLCNYTNNCSPYNYKALKSYRPLILGLQNHENTGRVSWSGKFFLLVDKEMPKKIPGVFFLFNFLYSYGYHEPFCLAFLTTHKIELVKVISFIRKHRSWARKRAHAKFLVNKNITSWEFNFHEYNRGWFVL